MFLELEKKMLEKFQVMLPGWLSDYIQFITDKYDIGFSETIRIDLCFAILCTIHKIYPEYKSDLSLGELEKILKKITHEPIEKKELDNIISRIYFETRKAVEYRLKIENFQSRK